MNSYSISFKRLWNKGDSSALLRGLGWNHMEIYSYICLIYPDWGAYDKKWLEKGKSFPNAYIHCI